MKRILLISLFAFLVPIYAMAAEPGCGDDESLYNTDKNGNPTIGAAAASELFIDEQSKWVQKAGIMLHALVNVNFLNYANPWNDDITYVIASSTKDFNNTKYIKSDKITLRIYNWKFDQKRSCSNCYMLDHGIRLGPGSDRPWMVNGTHTATRNGITIRLNTRAERQ